MATQFSTHLWLASPDTRSHYRAVVKVIETFDLSIENQMIDERYMSEETKAFDSLQPFYTHLEAKLDELQRKLIPKT